MPRHAWPLAIVAGGCRLADVRSAMLWGFACAWLLGTGSLSTASAGELVVKGTAEESITPQWIRVRCEVIGRGDNLQAAFGQLQINRAKSVARIKKLGAVEKSIRTGTPRLATHLFGTNELVPTPDLAGLQPVPVSLSLSEPVADRAKSPIVMSELIAEIPLVGGDELERMIHVESMTTQIKDSDLGGLKALPEGFVCKTCGGQVGQADVVLVAKLSEEDQRRLIAAALGRARADALKIAAATGSDLGSPKRIVFSGDRTELRTLEPLGSPFSMPHGLPGISGAADVPEELPVEVVGSDAGKLTLRIRVTATFELTHQ